MKLNRISWTTFFFLSIISFSVWLKFSYPQLAFSNFSVDRNQAIEIAKEFLRKKGDVNTAKYKVAAVFGMDRLMNRYMQKTVGFSGLKEFIQKNK